MNLICRPHTRPKATWTIGCSIEVFLHQYNQGKPEQKSYFIELWDVGGYKTHGSARSVFYDMYQGIILVHDLTNRKSFSNLRRWLGEVLAAGEGSSYRDNKTSDDFDAEMFIGKNIPVLIVGTKKDLLSSNRAARCRPLALTEECGASEIEINCLDDSAFRAGSTNCAEMTRFFDKVIERKYSNRTPKMTSILYPPRRLHMD